MTLQSRFSSLEETRPISETLINRVEANFEESSELNISESTTKRFVLEEEDEEDRVRKMKLLMILNKLKLIILVFPNENTEQSDGKVRFLLEDDEISNADTDLKHVDTQVLEADLMTTNSEETQLIKLSKLSQSQFLMND